MNIASLVLKVLSLVLKVLSLVIASTCVWGL